MAKSILRNEMLEKINSLEPEYRESASKQAIAKLTELSDYKDADVIFTFVSFNNEIDTHNFIKNSLIEGKKILIPYVNSKERKMYPIILKDFDELEVGHYGILCLPKEKLEFYEGKIDLVVTPGVIFDKRFYRIGYGAGYYDKFFADNLYTNKIGLCYDFQLRDEIINEAHDIPLDKIVTDKQIIERK